MPPDPPPSSPRPRRRTGRDLVVLAAVVAVLAVAVGVGSRVEYSLPISVGNVPVAHAAGFVRDAEDQLRERVRSQGGRLAEGAGCYFFRPLGPTQGAFPTVGFPGLFPPDAFATDVLFCGPVELAGQAANGSPWLAGVVAYELQPDGAAVGALQALIPLPPGLSALAGGVKADRLLDVDGRPPASDAVEKPTWRHVDPSGEPAAGPGAPTPPGVPVPTLPPGATPPPGPTIPALPPATANVPSGGASSAPGPRCLDVAAVVVRSIAAGFRGELGSGHGLVQAYAVGVPPDARTAEGFPRYVVAAKVAGPVISPSSDPALWGVGGLDEATVRPILPLDPIALLAYADRPSPGDAMTYEVRFALARRPEALEAQACSRRG